MRFFSPPLEPSWFERIALLCALLSLITNLVGWTSWGLFPVVALLIAIHARVS